MANRPARGRSCFFLYCRDESTPSMPPATPPATLRAEFSHLLWCFGGSAVGGLTVEPLAVGLGEAWNGLALGETIQPSSSSIQPSPSSIQPLPSCTYPCQHMSRVRPHALVLWGIDPPSHQPILPSSLRLPNPINRLSHLPQSHSCYLP